MDPLFAAGTALAVSLAIIPLMIRLAPRLRLLDEPNARKVHVQAIPRIGGWGISVGALAAVLLWLPMGPIAAGFAIGGLIVLVAGYADDARELPGKIKLFLQVLAVLPVVIYADLVVDVVPAIGDIHLPYFLATTVTVIGLITCINATNTSDGLDGLAAGATLLSLFGILYLASTVGAAQVELMTAAALGGLIGFLRYNTHPAIIFMGDLGSQFLGFAVGFLALALLNAMPGDVSPWALLLLIGLPTADIVVVAVRRLIAGKSLFSADQSHIHHRFLDLGFSHPQSVAAFYTLQGSFVFFGVALQNSAAWKILLVYALHFTVIYGFLYLAEASLGDRVVLTASGRITKRNAEPKQALLWMPRVVLETVLPLILVTSAVVSTNVTSDFGILGAVLLLLLVIRLFMHKLQSIDITRIPVFLVATAVLYVYTNNRPFDSIVSWLTEVTAIAALAAMAMIAVRFSPRRRKDEFRLTALDYLLVVFAILAIIALRITPSAFNPYFLVYLPVILYSCELLMIERRQRTNWLPPAALAAAAILTVRGLIIGA